MPKSKIAVAGAGLIGRTQIALIQASRECELSGIVDPAPASAELAHAAGVPRYQTLGALFAAQRPDGVILATPNQLHVQNALECIDAGVAALIEKPVADSVGEGVRLHEAAERAGPIAGGSPPPAQPVARHGMRDCRAG